MIIVNWTGTESQTFIFFSFGVQWFIYMRFQTVATRRPTRRVPKNELLKTVKNIQKAYFKP